LPFAPSPCQQPFTLSPSFRKDKEPAWPPKYQAKLIAYHYSDFNPGIQAKSANVPIFFDVSYQIAIHKLVLNERTMTMHAIAFISSSSSSTAY
jgi:hypothetical protein